MTGLSTALNFKRILILTLKITPSVFVLSVLVQSLVTSL